MSELASLSPTRGKGGADGFLLEDVFLLGAAIWTAGEGARGPLIAPLTPGAT
jgi:hypothetical protein